MLLSIGPLGTNFCEISIKISNFSFTKMQLKISCAKWRPCCPGSDELILKSPQCHTYASENMVSTGADNGLASIRRQYIILSNVWLLSIRSLGTNFSEILIQIRTSSFMKMHLKISSATLSEERRVKWQVETHTHYPHLIAHSRHVSQRTCRHQMSNHIKMKVSVYTGPEINYSGGWFNYYRNIKFIHTR